MLRGIYTSASGMIMNQEKLNVLANNLANVNQTAFKADTAVMKAFPQMLIQRTRDEGLGVISIGSFDEAPIVGRLGTGVEFNENYTQFRQGNALKTENPLDVLITEQPDSQTSKKSVHFFNVRTDNGELLTRNGSFTLDKNGYLVTQDGYTVQGENGDIQLLRNNFIINQQGEVWINNDIGNQLPDATSSTTNDWGNPTLLDTIKVQRVESPRYLEKVGDSFYRPTLESGPPISESRGDFTIKQGYLEASNVNLVTQMVEMINTQRNYEANQKSVVSQDQLLGKLINEVSR